MRAAAFTLVAMLVGLSACPDRAHPSDADMLAAFAAHRDGFSRLLEMIREDRGLMRVDGDRTWPDDHESAGVKESRIGEYRALLRTMGIRGGLAVSADRRVVELVVSSRGFVTHGSEKGYLHDEGRACVVVEGGLDQMAQVGTGSGCRNIEYGWHLYFEGQ